MSNVIDVVFEGIQIGAIIFEEAPRHLRAYRTAGGFALELPIKVRLKMEASSAPQPLLSDISARLSIQTHEGYVHQIGHARHDGYFLGAVPEADSSGELLWADTLSALAYYEEIRAGKPPQMRIELRAEVCYLLAIDERTLPQRPPFNRQLRSHPWRVTGTADATYPTEVWGRMLRELRFIDTVFVQVPLPTDPPTKWENVWREVGLARTAFEQGGETGWTACVVAVRRALEAWRDIEGDKMWPGWQEPTREQREAWAKGDRLMGLRWHLRQAAHPAAHASGEVWSREDARLMLATLSALLAVRNP